MGAERTHEVPNVVAHRLAADLQRLLDLRRRCPAGEQVKHLCLARRQHGRDLRALADARGPQQPEDADNATLLADGDRAHVRKDTPPVCVVDLELEIGRVLAVKLAKELLTRAAAILRGDDIGEVPVDDVARKRACRGI